MRTFCHHLIGISLIVLLLFLPKSPSFSQGRVVINEYMPWTPSTCGVAAEFVELLNFGPGPVNIGCYILTDGDYSITIPANTILQPGEFYVISGQDITPGPCANIDSTIHPDLNWTTCNCTSTPIPTTGDGFMTDGGSANEQLVLFDANFAVIDAVARSLPVETASLITSSTNGGVCTAHTFDLDLLSISYETIGESAGRGNSFARRLDGDCGWVKDPQQSGNATNNTPGDISDVSYSFFYTRSQACPNNGSIAVTVHASDYSNVFPMSYTLAFDTDGDGIFEITDSYTTGTVNNPNTIAIGNLVPGTYRLTVASVKGCYLHTFPFVILSCYPPLAVKLISFNVQSKNSQFECKWSIDQSEQLSHVVIERSADGSTFSPFVTIAAPQNVNGTWNYNYHFIEYNTLMPFFRLQMHGKTGMITLSSVIDISKKFDLSRIWPNPATNHLNIQFFSSLPGNAEIAIYNISSCQVLKKKLPVQAGSSVLSIPIDQLSPGMYQLSLQSISKTEPTRWFHFVKL
ncbi:MAG: lamin tail domain-containing protein [Chitinophagaceae bacterium]